MDRLHRLAIAGLLTVLVTTSGCVGTLMGEDLTFSASQPAVDEEAVEEADYDLEEKRDVTINHTVNIQEEEREIEVTNKIAAYSHNVSAGPIADQKAAGFVVAASPAVEVAGVTANPVDDYSNRELLKQISSRYDEVDDIERVGSQNVTVLGSETEVTKFSATTTIEGERVDVYLHVMKTQHEDDFVMAVGGYPQELDAQHEDRVLTLIEGIEHPETDSTSENETDTEN